MTGVEPNELSKISSYTIHSPMKRFEHIINI